MHPKQIANLRLENLHLSGGKYKNPTDLVSYMGALQAQDYYMSKWAAGIRIKEIGEKEIQATLDKGEILRTHLLRPTWHLVASKNIYWLKNLSAARIKSALSSRDKELELNEKIYSKSLKIMEGLLSNGRHLTAKEISLELQKKKIDTGNNRASHIFIRGEIEGLICSGVLKENQQTYALLSERVPHKYELSKAESIIKLAELYFTSRGPASLQDFVWWSGLSLKDARDGLEAIKTKLTSVKYEEQVLWFKDSGIESIPEKKQAFLLPAFDEFIISYKDRSAVIPHAYKSKAITINGLFRPVILINGEAAGIWKRTIGKEMVTIETEFFENPDRSTQKYLSQAIDEFSNYVEKKVIWKQL